MTPEATTAIGQAIQLAVAPALILVAIGNLINVVAVRLARIIDRARWLERNFPTESGEERRLAVAELGSLGRRMKLCHASVGFITAGGILVCLLVMLLFVEFLNRTGYAVLVSSLFIGAMVTLAIGLLLFLAEISIAIRVVKVREEVLHRARD
jgi:hypothetical protein